MAETKYKIVSIWYTKPVIRPDANGGIVFGRASATVTVGELDNFSIGMKKVEKIEYDKNLNAFKIYYTKGGLKVIPMREDTEVSYEEIK